MDKEFEEKLRSFKSAVLGEAKAKGDKKLDKTKKKTDEIIEKNETEYLSEAYDKIQSKIRSIRRSDNERVLQADVEARRKLLKAREDMVNKVFMEAREKLAAFKVSEDYVAWLENKIENALSQLGDGSISVQLCESDRAVAEKISAKFSNVNFVFESDDAIGGVRVYNDDKRTAVDYRFSEMLDMQRSEFLRTGGLSIN